jgi:hypothetical protein
MTDKTIEAKHWLRWSGYSLASCSPAVLPPLHRTLDLITSKSDGQSTLKFGRVYSLFQAVFCPTFAVHPILSLIAT